MSNIICLCYRSQVFLQTKQKKATQQQKTNFKHTEPTDSSKDSW